MKRYSITAALLSFALAFFSHQHNCRAVWQASGDSLEKSAAGQLSPGADEPGNVEPSHQVARLPVTDIELAEEPIERLPTVSSIRPNKVGEIVRLFAKDCELPPAQSLPPQPSRQLARQTPSIDHSREGGRAELDDQVRSTIPQVDPAPEELLDANEDLTGLVAQPAARGAARRLMPSNVVAESILADAQSETQADEQDRPSSPSDRVQDMLRANVLVQPLSGTYDFTEPMSATSDHLDSFTDVDPHQLGRISLPASLAARVDSIISDATQLADRGAIFAAQREFLRALRMTTRALDTSIGRPYHAQALANGLRALEEADDFSLDAADSVEADLRLANYIKGHRTPILKRDDPASLTPLIALQRYYEYAREQLTLAGGGSPLAARAIYSMGRVEMLQQSQTSKMSSGAPRALALFHAALTIDPQNAPAANELGVMLASRGRLQEAAALLERSVASAPTPAAAENLATVYEQLQDPRGARWRQYAQRVAQQAYGAAQIPQQPIVWLDPQAFASTDPEAGQPWPASTASADRPNQIQPAAALMAPHSQAARPLEMNAGNATYHAPQQLAPQHTERRWW